MQKSFRGEIMDKLKKEFITKFLESATEAQLNKVFAKVVDIELGNDVFTPYVPYYPNKEEVKSNDWVTVTSTGIGTGEET
jgi:uncharacterized protein YjdB